MIANFRNLHDSVLTIMHVNTSSRNANLYSDYIKSGNMISAYLHSLNCIDIPKIKKLLRDSHTNY